MQKNPCVLENLRPVSPGSDARLCEPHRPLERTKQNERVSQWCRVGVGVPEGPQDVQHLQGGINFYVACL